MLSMKQTKALEASKAKEKKWLQQHDEMEKEINEMKEACVVTSCPLYNY